MYSECPFQFTSLIGRKTYLTSLSFGLASMNNLTPNTKGLSRVIEDSGRMQYLADGAPLQEVEVESCSRHGTDDVELFDVLDGRAQEGHFGEKHRNRAGRGQDRGLLETRSSEIKFMGRSPFEMAR